MYTTLKEQQLNSIRSQHTIIWEDLIDSIIKSISNIEISNYPYFKLNPNGSISFFIEDSEEYSEHISNFSFLDQDLAKESLAEECIRSNYKIIGNEQIVEKISHEEIKVIEYKINLNLDDFDSILKLNYKYNGYKGKNSIFNILKKNFELKPGVIRLFPVCEVTDVYGEGDTLQSSKLYLIRAQGCQMSEMATVQLRKIIIDLLEDNLENQQDLFKEHFHWMPRIVEEKLGISWSDIQSIFNKVLPKKYDDKIYFQNQVEYIINEPGEEGCISISDLDPEDLHFYKVYSNLSTEELKFCKSLQIDTVAFLEEIQLLIEEKCRSEYVNLKELNIKLNPSIHNLTVMLEKLKESMLQTQDPTSSHTSLKMKNL